MNQKNDTLFGGRLFTALLANNEQEQIKVAQLALGDYEKAYSLVDSEFAITAFCCFTVGDTEVKSVRKKVDWINTLTPESYEQLQAVVQEVNANGFFSFASRRKEKDWKMQEKIIGAMANMPADVIKMAAELGANSTSATSSPVPRPR